MTRVAHCLAGAAVALAGATCRPPVTPPAQWHEEGAYRWRDLSVRRRGGPGFTQLSASETGLTFTNSVHPEHALQNRHLAFGGGVTLGDVDGDGLPDVYLTSNEGSNALYKNLGAWRFADVTARAGVALAGRHSTGAVLADVNGDRALDLLVSTLGGGVALFLNDGHGVFTEATTRAGLTSHTASMTMTLSDVDGDGRLDLYVANYKGKSTLDALSPQERAFDQVVHKVGDHFEVVERFRNDYRIEVLKELGAVVLIQRAEPDAFYLNDGTGHFTLVPWTSGRFLDENGDRLTSAPDYFGLSAKFTDVDGDGAPDLYVCDDFQDPDMFWLNDGHGTFRLAPRRALRTSSNSSMGVDFADIDRDGQVDFFVADMLGRGRRQKTETPTHTPLPKLIGRIDDRPQWQRNTLFVNRGDGTFAEIASYAGVEASDWSWAPLFLDVDLDGYEDLLVTTGHEWDVMDSDTWERVRNTVTGVDWHQELGLFPKLALTNVAFRNNGDRTFTDVSQQWGFANEAAVSHGMAAADLDGDGALDVVVNRLGAAVGVFRNDATAPRVAVRLMGRAPNTAAAGSKIRVLGGPVSVQQKEVTLGGTYLSGSDPLYTFAAGSAREVTIEVAWRSGAHTVVRGVQPNREYEIREPAEGPDAARPNIRPLDARPRPLFTDVSAALGHRHVETPYNDDARQSLLPNSLSQLGPGITWYDVDDDGREDLLIPSGRGGALAYYRNAGGGRFAKGDLEMGHAPLDQTTVLAVPAVNGRTTLLVGQSSYEALAPAAALAAPTVLAVQPGARSTITPVVPGDASSVGPLALADVDGDGQLDLFVGGRVIPGAYPEPASSRLFLNRDGRFVPDTINQRLFTSLGLVSAAVFSDINGDGYPDLVVAPEWGPLKLFLNEKGRFREAGAEWGLATYSSRWNGVTTGDLDGDGRPDIIATSWGRNTERHADEGHPLLLYYGDLSGAGGSFELVEAQYDDRLHAVAPLGTLARLTLSMPVVRERVRTFAAYANATLQEAFGPRLERAGHVAATTLDHVMFLNRGTTFHAVPLPAEAQFAPAFAVAVADFDGDGNEDGFLSQNFFPTEVGTRRYDAGRGLLLRGDGRGDLEPLAGRISGIMVYGDQRGAAFADFNADGRVDLAVSQNGAETKLYRNDGGRAGLRVRLVGAPGNPRAFGAAIRLVYGDRKGPAREIHGGSGYWSQDGAVQVLGLAGSPTGVWVRWPGGRETVTPLAAGRRTLTIRQP